MNLNLTGHHLDITPAIRDYVVGEARSRDASLRPRDRRQRRDVGGQAAAQGRGQPARARQGHPRRGGRARHVRGDRRAGRQARPPGRSSTRKSVALHRHEGAAIKRDVAATEAAPAAPGGPARRTGLRARSLAYTRRGVRAGGPEGPPVCICGPATTGCQRPRHDPFFACDEPDRRVCCRPRTSCSTSTRGRRRACSTRSARCSRRNRGAVAKRVVVDSLLAREKLGSTGLGQGIAIPHGRIKGLDEAQGAFVRLQVARSRSTRRTASPSRQVFVLLVPEQATEQHLQLLSELAQMFSETPLSRAARRTPADARRLHALFEQWAPAA